MQPLDVLIVYNAPQLPANHPDAASERGVLDSVAAIQQALAAGGHQPRQLAIGPAVHDVVWQLQAALPCDVVFNLCEGLGGVGHGESQVTGLLELLGATITGSGSECLALVRHKPRTKWLLAGAGLPTAEFCLLEADQPIDGATCQSLLEKGPVIVKPAHEDASLGIAAESVVTELGPLESQIEKVRSRYGSVLIERFIAGREFNAAVIALPEPVALPLSEIAFAEDGEPFRIVTYEAKWDTGSPADRHTPARCPADIAPALAERIRQVAVAAFQVTGCRDYARIDLRMDQQSRIYILEVNGNPDLSPHAGLARSVAAQGRKYDAFICSIVEHAFDRRQVGPQQRLAVSSVLPASGPHARNERCTIRSMEEADLRRLVEILQACSVFRTEEISVGEEVLRESLRKPTPDDYQVLVAEIGDKIAGWSCHGRVPMTDATYDLYWIAVDPVKQNAGVGRQLIASIVENLRGTGARWLLAETSASAAYVPTRLFYERVGFQTLSEIPDFYRPRDGRVIFGMRLTV